MKEFISAVEDDVADQEREDQIAALVAQGKTRKQAETEVDRGTPVEFKLDDRVMHAYRPHEGQLIFLMASLGRGQSKETRVAGIVNILMESLDEDDKDYFEGRLLTSDTKNRLRPQVIEGIFEHLTSEWFREAVPSGGTAVSDRS